MKLPVYLSNTWEDGGLEVVVENPLGTRLPRTNVNRIGRSVCWTSWFLGGRNMCRLYINAYLSPVDLLCQSSRTFNPYRVNVLCLRRLSSTYGSLHLILTSGITQTLCQRSIELGIFTSKACLSSECCACICDSDGLGCCSKRFLKVAQTTPAPTALLNTAWTSFFHRAPDPRQRACSGLVLNR